MINYFERLGNPKFDLDEVTRLWRYYSNQTEGHYITDITNLLNAVSVFQCATTLDPHFKNVRDQVKTDDELLVRLNEVARMIRQTQTKYSHQQPSEIEQAIDYCIKAIELHLTQLKEQNDRVYKIYSDQDNDLKEVVNTLIRKSPKI